MTKMCKIYLALCLVSGFYMASVAGLFFERVLIIESFKYERCNPAQNDKGQDFTLLHFNVTVTSYGSVHFTGSFLLESNVTSPWTATIDLRKSVIFGFMFKIPCFGAFGSCTINDLCIYGEPEGVECPPVEEEVDFPCRCPVEPGKYKMPGVWIHNMAKTRWAYLFTGYYAAMITLYQGGKEMTCYNIEFTLE